MATGQNLVDQLETGHHEYTRSEDWLPQSRRYGWRPPRHSSSINSLAPLSGITVATTLESQSPFSPQGTVRSVWDSARRMNDYTVDFGRIELRDLRIINTNDSPRLPAASYFPTSPLGQQPEIWTISGRVNLNESDCYDEATSFTAGQPKKAPRTYTLNFDRVIEVAIAVGAGDSISIATDAKRFAIGLGASEAELTEIAQLCARFVPLATLVSVNLRIDPEEGWELLRVGVRTSASPAALVAAEDDLHDALFDRVPASIRSHLSIAYGPQE
jgi:hypothetical protein